jgi:hypothetical protein
MARINPKTDAELTAEVERDIGSGAFLENLKPIHNANAKPPRAVYSLRLSIEEFQEFEAAAKARRMTLSDFLRSAAHVVIEADKASGIGLIRTKAHELVDAIDRL